MGTPVSGRLRRAVAACVACAFVAAAAPARAAGEALEFAVKAQFLSRFGGFVEWPDAAFAGPAAPLVICVVGDDPFAGALDKAATGQQAAGRALAVRRLRAVRADSGCHIAYFAPSEGAKQAAQVEALKAAPVLTVTDARSGGAGGIVHFVLNEQRVRFEIDDGAADEADLVVSSKLLGLALTVRPRKGGSR